MRDNHGSLLACLPLVIVLVAIRGCCEKTIDVPDAPYALSVGFVGANRIDLSWGHSSDTDHWVRHWPRRRGRQERARESRHDEREKQIIGFKIERKLGRDGSWAQIARVGSSVVAWSDVTAMGNATHYYRVCAYNEDGDSKWSNVTSGTATQAAPTDLTAHAWTHTVYLEWADHAADETGYKVERRPEAGSYSQVAMVGENATSYVDRGLSPGTYHYRVRAYNDYGASAYSNEASAIIAAPDEGGRD